MHTSRSEIDAITFMHDGTPDNGDLHIVINVDEANQYNANQKSASKYGYNVIRFESKDRTDIHGPIVRVTVPYNIVRDFVLSNLRNLVIGELESLDGEELVKYFTREVEKP